MTTKRKQSTVTASTTKTAGKLAVENVNVPGYTHRVDARLYEAMRKAMLKMLPRKAPGMTQSEMWTGLRAYAPKKLFPDSGKIGWWMKTVQLDLEAKHIVVREATKPLRWHLLK